MKSETRLPSQQIGQPFDVLIGDVPTILAQVRRDAVGARRQGQLGRAHRVGQLPAPGVPDSGHVVDVDPEPKRPGHAFSLRLPGSSIGMAASSGGS